MIPPLETPRLHLRPLALEDAPAIQEQFARWEIVRHLASRVPWPHPADGALTFVRDVALPGMARSDAWHWSLRLRQAPDQLISVAGLLRGERENRGIWIGLPWQGAGSPARSAGSWNGSGSTCSASRCCTSPRPWSTPRRGGCRSAPA